MSGEIKGRSFFKKNQTTCQVDNLVVSTFLRIFVLMKTTTDINQRFQYLASLADMVINNQTPSLVVVGQGGLGKTHTIKQAIYDNCLLNEEFAFIKGYSTARGLYNTLYDNNGKLIIFDDCDSVLEDKVALNILKSALDSYDVRQITWSAKLNKSDKYPQQFNFTGRVIFISNKDKESIDQAILTRSFVVDLSMTADEKIDRMAHILPHILPEFNLEDKVDALQYLDQNKHRTNLSLRSLITTTKLRVANPKNWKQIADFMVQ